MQKQENLNEEKTKKKNNKFFQSQVFIFVWLGHHHASFFEKMGGDKLTLK